VTEVSERYARTADGFAARLAGVATDAWDARSPCEDWTARDVARHVIEVHRRVLARIDDAEPEPLEPDGDLDTAWAEATGAVREALDDPQRAATVVGGIFGEQPFESLVGRLLCADTLVHTWDLARATGQDDHLDLAAIDAAAAFLEPIDETIRRPGGFGPKLTPPDGADAQTRLLCFLGRTP
jgi:uncharacterized protein (TIGR03086 family)